MQVVIDIPEEKLKWIKEYPDVYTGWQNEAIRNGTIIEADKAEDVEVWNGMNGQVVMPKGTFMKIYNECKDEEDDDI